MLKRIQRALNLLPKGVSVDSPTLSIQVGVVNGLMHIQIDRPVSLITFNKEQLSKFLGAVAGQSSGVK